MIGGDIAVGDVMGELECFGGVFASRDGGRRDAGRWRFSWEKDELRGDVDGFAARW